MIAALIFNDYTSPARAQRTPNVQMIRTTKDFFCIAEFMSLEETNYYTHTFSAVAAAPS